MARARPKPHFGCEESYRSLRAYLLLRFSDAVAFVFKIGEFLRGGEARERAATPSGVVYLADGNRWCRFAQRTGYKL